MARLNANGQTAMEHPLGLGIFSAGFMLVCGLVVSVGWRFNLLGALAMGLYQWLSWRRGGWLRNRALRRSAAGNPSADV